MDYNKTRGKIHKIFATGKKRPGVEINSWSE
jgi:hypothetical protein